MRPKATSLRSRAILSAAPLQPDHRMHRQFGVDMREERAAARRFPADSVAEAGEVHLGDHQTGLAREIFGDRLFELLGGRQVDIAVGDIHRGAAEHAFAFEVGPLLGGQDLEGGGRGHSVAPSGAGSAASSTAGVSSSPSSVSSSLSPISAADTTCSSLAPSNSRTPAEPRPMTRKESSPMRISLAWSVTSIS